MKLFKKVLIVTLALAFIASMGAAAVGAQTSESVSTPTVQAAASSDFARVATNYSATAASSAMSTGHTSVATSTPVVGTTYKTPTTLNIIATSQSARNNSQQLILGYLRTGDRGIRDQPVELWIKTGNNPAVKASTGKTFNDTRTGLVGWYVWTTNETAHTTQYYFVYRGTSTYAAATSNVIAIKYEKKETKPYQTNMIAYAPKQVVAKGTTSTMWVRLMNGPMPVPGQYIYVWKWSGGKWVCISRHITRTSTQLPGAGWVLVDYKLKTAGTGLFKFSYFGTSPYYGPKYAQSESNSVQLMWK